MKKYLIILGILTLTSCYGPDYNYRIRVFYSDGSNEVLYVGETQYIALSPTRADVGCLVAYYSSGYSVIACQVKRYEVIFKTKVK